MTKSSTDPKLSSFKQSLANLFTIPPSVHIAQLPIEETSKLIFQIFDLLGYLTPQKLWETVHLFGVPKGETTPLFENPALVFANLYKTLEESCANTDNFDANKFLDHAFNMNDDMLADIFGYEAISAKIPGLKNLSLHEFNDLIITNLTVYIAQNGFNRELGQERVEFFINKQSNSSNQLSNLDALNEHYKQLGYIDQVLPSIDNITDVWILGSSFYAMQRTFEFAIKEVFSKIYNKKEVDFHMLTGWRTLNEVDSSPFLKGNDYISYLIDALEKIATFKGVTLDQNNPLIIDGTKLRPNIEVNSEDPLKFTLIETHIAEYLLNHNASSFSDFKNITVIDTPGEPNPNGTINRASTYTTSTQAFLEIIGNMLVLEDQNIAPHNIVIVTTGAPFIQRQGCTIALALKDVIKNLIDVTKTNHFADKKELGHAILDTLKLKLPPSKLIQNIATYGNKQETDGLVDIFKSFDSTLNKIQESFHIQPVGEGIADVPYLRLIQMLIGEPPAHLYDLKKLNYDYDNVDITVGYQDRERNTTSVPPLPDNLHDFIKNLLQEDQYSSTIGLESPVFSDS